MKEESEIEKWQLQFKEDVKQELRLQERERTIRMCKREHNRKVVDMLSSLKPFIANQQKLKVRS